MYVQMCTLRTLCILIQCVSCCWWQTYGCVDNQGGFNVVVVGLKNLNCTHTWKKKQHIPDTKPTCTCTGTYNRMNVYTYVQLCCIYYKMTSLRTRGLINCWFFRSWNGEYSTLVQCWRTEHFGYFCGGEPTSGGGKSHIHNTQKTNQHTCPYPDHGRQFRAVDLLW